MTVPDKVVDSPPFAPQWICRHALAVGEFYFTNDSDLVLEYVGYAQVRDQFGFRYVMVFRDQRTPGPLLTLTEPDADECAGFTALADHLADELHKRAPFTPPKRGPA